MNFFMENMKNVCSSGGDGVCVCVLGHDVKYILFFVVF